MHLLTGIPSYHAVPSLLSISGNTAWVGSGVRGAGLPTSVARLYHGHGVYDPALGAIWICVSIVRGGAGC